MTRTGRCLCGAVRFTAREMDGKFSACHCGMCRRWSGGPGLAVEARDVAFEGEENIAVYKSSDWAERAFCKVCGSSLYYRFLGEGPMAGTLHMQLGLLDDDSGLEFSEEIFVDHKSGLYEFAGDRERLTEAEVMALFGVTDGGEA